MQAGPHYYVISLSKRGNAFHEAFRDTLIEIENGGFPVMPAHAGDREGPGDDGEWIRDALKAVDQCFAAYHRSEPLKLVLVGEETVLSTFSSLSRHLDAVVGRVVGDFSGTSLRDLGKIVWPLVKDAMSGLHGRAMRELEVASQQRRLVYGLDAVSKSIFVARGATLLVETGFHRRGSIYEEGDSLQLTDEVDVAATMDDIVDVVIERTVAAGGYVVFMPDEMLKALGRIALLLADEGKWSQE